MPMDALNKWAQRDLKYIFSDKELVISLLETDEKKLANRIDINADGSITLGKTQYKWINRLLNAEITLSPEVVCLRLIKLITGFGASRNDEAYKDLCNRFSQYYKDGNYNIAISAIFVAYRFVLAPDIKELINNSSEKGECNTKVNKEISINGVIVKDGTELYNPFGCVLAQCLSHILRYLKPYYEDIKHQAPKKMSDFLSNCNTLRNIKFHHDRHDTLYSYFYYHISYVAKDNIHH